MTFMTHLAGTSSTNGDHDPLVFIRRSMIGKIFRDLSYHLGDLLGTIQQDIEAMRARGRRWMTVTIDAGA